MNWKQNRPSKYHIRHGEYDGIGYYHVSDRYIALFSHFIPCGFWEWIYILDMLLSNKSDISAGYFTHGHPRSKCRHFSPVVFAEGCTAAKATTLALCSCPINRCG